jgi:hypothetical protein
LAKNPEKAMDRKEMDCAVKVIADTVLASG